MITEKELRYRNSFFDMKRKDFSMFFFSKNKKPKLNVPLIQRKCGVTAICLKEVTSTNDILKEYAKQGAPTFTAVIAESQTGGRGRGDHHFYSPHGSGIYMSVLLKPKGKSFKPADITAAAGVAACEAIESVVDTDCRIKWMNDVLIEGKKVCGILAESTTVFDERFVIVGAGFNINTPEGGFPEDISDIAGSILQDRSVSGVREKLVIAFFRKLDAMTRASSSELYRAYKDRLFVLGQTVIYEGQKAVVTDLLYDFRLEITLENGEKKQLDSGEISLPSLS